jgi:hypothetical protein
VPLIVSPRRLEIEAGKSAEIRVTTPPITVARGEAASGVLTITPLAGTAVRIPWAVVLRRSTGLLGPPTLSRRRFKPSEQKPAVVAVRAGRVFRSQGGSGVVPVLRLDVELWTAKGKRLGLVARLRDVLPGRYAFGLTGGGEPDSRSVAFTIR